MITKIQRWGNSQGIRLSRDVLADAGLEVGEAVEVSVREGAVVLTPARRVRGGVDLAELVARISQGDRTTETVWGPARGGEAW